MQKILISDYDDTFHIEDKNEEENMKINIEAVKKFRKNGNLFVIATARNPQSIKKEIEKYNIKCDYVISYIGGVIEKDNKVVYVNYLRNEVVDNIENVLKKYKNIEISRMGLKEDIRENEILGYKVDTKGDLLVLKDIANELKNIKQIFSRTFDNIQLYINNSSNSKVKAIHHLVKLLNIENKEIYTIGDSDDDLDMLLEYNGYRMEESSDIVVQRIDAKVSSVADLLKKF